MTQILVVDDEQSILELIKNGLRKDGYLITACQTAADVDMQKLHLYDWTALNIVKKSEI